MNPITVKGGCVEMKKLLAFLMAILVFGTMLAGCGGGGDKKAAAPKK